MVIKIDKIDKKILLLLLENSRFSNSFIAKRLKVSTQLIKYRIERLKTEKIIIKYITSIMRNSLGMIRYYNIYLKIKKTKIKEKESIIRYLLNDPRVIQLFEADGCWNLGFEVTSAIQLEIEPIIDKIHKLSKGYIEDLKVYNICYKRFMKRQPLLTENLDISFIKRLDLSFQKEITNAKNTFFWGVAKLDKCDLQILSVLRNNAKISLYSLSQKIKYNVLTIKNHIKNLIKKGIIKQFTTDIDFDKLGYKRAIILLNVTNDEKKQIISYIKEKCPAVEVVFGYLDYWNFGVVLFFNNINEIDYFLEELLNNFKDYIMDYDKLIIKKIKTDSFNENFIEEYSKAINLLEPK